MNWKLHHSTGRNIWRSFKLFGKHSKIWFCCTEMIPPPKKKEIRCVHNQRWQHLKTPTTGALQYIQPRRKCWKLQIKWLKVLKIILCYLKHQKGKRKILLEFLIWNQVGCGLCHRRATGLCKPENFSAELGKDHWTLWDKALQEVSLKFNIKQSDLSWQMGEYRLAK